MQVLQNAQRTEGSLQVESSRKTGVLVYKSSWVILSVTSRREISRRDVRFHVATSFLKLSVTSRCEKSTLRRHFLKPFVTSRRGILTSRRGILTSRREILTSRRHLVTYSATSRRGLARRDVIWSISLSRRDVNPHVTTWACLLSVTSRRGPVFSPRMVHFTPSPYALFPLKP